MMSLQSSRFYLALFSVLQTVGCGESTDFGVSGIDALVQPIVGTCSSANSVDHAMPQNCGSDMQSPDPTEAQVHCRAAYYPVVPSADLLKACAHMFMAKYHKDISLAFTYKGTRIEWADKDTSLGNSPREFGIYNSNSQLRLFEAIWGKDGAICVSKPRWSGIYDSFHKRTTTVRLPDCRERPSDPAKPWLGNPFSGGGLLVSYAVNWNHAYMVSWLRPDGEVQTGGDGYEVIDTFTVYNAETVPLGDGTKSGSDYEYQPDLDYGRAHHWRACYPKGGNSVCDSITTLSDLSQASELTAREIPTDRRYVRAWMARLIDPLIFSDGKQCIVHRRAKSCWH